MKYTLLFIFFTCTMAHAQFITNNGIELTNSARVVTDGDWINDPGTNIINNGIIQTSESFVNNGTLDPASTGGFVLQYAVDLNFTPGGSSMGFLTKDGAGTALVTGTIGIKDSLILKNGLIRLLNTNDTVAVKKGGTVSSGPGAYVEGLFARAGTGDLIFPIGKDGKYLPLKLYKAQAQKITASVMDAPAGYAAGPGLDSLINFPYVWKIQEKANADTAAYVELNYPNTLPIGANPIVVREISGQKYASMGARFKSNASGRVTIRSYSRGLKGVFTVANGFANDPVTDSLALVALYNSTGGTSWTTKTNWLTGDISTWAGVTVTGQNITALNLSSNNLTGAVPDPLVDIVALQSINLSANNILSIPDFTANKQLTTLDVSGNKLDFNSLEPNASVPGIVYNNQAVLGTPKDSLVAVGSAFDFIVNAGGQSSQYQWKRNGLPVAGATAPLYSVASIDRTTMGEYVAQVTNPLLPGLTLTSAPQNTLAYATVTGKLFASPNVAASQGKMTLFRITPLAYDTIGTVPVLADGTYSFSKIILDNYQLLGFADTLTHAGALPTYYKNTVFWEEADTVFLENNLSGLNITSNAKPAAPSGRGSISGYLVEDDGTASGRLNKTQKVKRVGGAGASARRVERTGRGKEEILTLVAYTFTNDEGEFNIPNLPVGEYRLNIQYPGYPMDETSFTTITIGTALQSQVSVEARVTDGKINVQKRIITGIADPEHYNAVVYPNPAIDFVHLQFAEPSAGRVVALIDASGKALKSTPAENKDVVVNVENLVKGLYFLQVNGNDGVTLKTFKVSIE